MTGTASILPRTIAALTALLLAGGLFAWMNATGDGVARLSDTLGNQAKANELVWSWIGQAAESRAMAVESPVPNIIEVPSVFSPWAEGEDPETEFVENPFGLVACGDFGFFVTPEHIGLLLVFGALAGLFALGNGALRAIIRR